MGDGGKTPLRLQFKPQIRLEFHGATITSDAGFLAFRELDDALDLTPKRTDIVFQIGSPNAWAAPDGTALRAL